jgi:hypothetical protein
MAFDEAACHRDDKPGRAAVYRLEVADVIFGDVATHPEAFVQLRTHYGDLKDDERRSTLLMACE